MCKQNIYSVEDGHVQTHTRTDTHTDTHAVHEAEYFSIE